MASSAARASIPGDAASGTRPESMLRTIASEIFANDRRSGGSMPTTWQMVASAKGDANSLTKSKSPTSTSESSIFSVRRTVACSRASMSWARRPAASRRRTVVCSGGSSDWMLTAVAGIGKPTRRRSEAKCSGARRTDRQSSYRVRIHAFSGSCQCVGSIRRRSYILYGSLIVSGARGSKAILVR